MNTLHNDVMNYLSTLGFNVLDKTDGYVTADKAGFGGTRDTWQIWSLSAPDGENSQLDEQHLLSDFEKRGRVYPNASRWLVADTFGGFSQRFRNEAEKKFGIRFRVPIQFFDTPFKSEGITQSTATAINDLRRQVPRIPQPYSVLANGETTQKGEDILEHLRNEFRFAEKSCLRIVVGPAGVGKTWFFRNLFAGLYNHFQTQKNKLETFPRPIPLIPQYFHGRGVTLRTQDLVREFIESEVETYIPQSAFEWMLTRGYASWLFDGLDELYAGDSNFFEILADLLTRPPESKTQILICARESLLSSSPNFADFIKDFPPGISEEPKIELYRLERWDNSSKRAFAGLHLSNPQRETNFLNYISRSDSLRTLSSLPYYCSLLVEEFKRDRTEDFTDDFTLLSHAITGIIDREKEKGVLIQSNLQPNGLDEWLETIASVCYATNFKGINKTDAETYAMLVAHPDLSESERTSTITTLIQFPLLARGVEAGILTFEHELIAEYLVGRYWLRRLISDPPRMAHELSTRVDFADSLVGRYISSQLPKQPDGIDAITRALRQEALLGKDFTVLLQLLLMADPAQDILRRHSISVEGRDLGEVNFINRNLAGLSFRNCNLSNTVFENCNLQNARFEGAYLAGTKFTRLSDKSLENTQFGNIERLEFVYIGQKRVDDRVELFEWIQKVTGIVEPIKEPCATTLQVRSLFLKFVNHDGHGRRSEMAEDTLSRGKRYPKAPTPEECLEASIRAGYLQRLGWHNRVRRVPGEQYDDIVDLVKDWKLSAHMREMLGLLCPIKNCEHIPEAFRSS